MKEDTKCERCGHLILDHAEESERNVNRLKSLLFRLTIYPINHRYIYPIRYSKGMKYTVRDAYPGETRLSGLTKILKDEEGRVLRSVNASDKIALEAEGFVAVQMAGITVWGKK